MSASTIRLHRVLRATPEKMYRAFIDADAMCKWLPPHGFTGKVHHMDARVGGTYKMSFTNFSTGKSHSFGGEYLELVPHERLRYTDRFDDPNLPGEMQTTVTLKKVSCGKSETTWEYLDESERRFKPLTLDPGAATAPGDARPHRLWVIDGNIRLRRWRDDKRTGTVKATRELLDVDARIRHMDELRVDVQVLYPTLFLHALTDRPETDVALCKSYNRWIAKATEKSRGRLRWVAMLPLLDIDKSIDEVRWAKDHGACGVFKKGIECGDRAASDPYFFPVYEEASNLDLPVCIHNATGKVESAIGQGSGLDGNMNAISAFCALAENAIPDMFPKLRVGFIETGASWIPFLYADLEAKKLRRTFLPVDFKEDLFRRNRFYVACQTNDDLPYILKYGTEDSLMIGTDYSHADQSAEIGALDVIEERAAKGEISPTVARKILDDNPRRFYGL